MSYYPPCLHCDEPWEAHGPQPFQKVKDHVYEPDFKSAFTVTLPEILTEVDEAGVDEETGNSGIDMTRAEYICEDLDKPGYDKKIVKRASSVANGSSHTHQMPPKTPTIPKFSEEVEEATKTVKTEVDKEQGIEPNLFGSKVNNNIHMPMFDIDYSAELIPSSTKGHFHLYLNRPVTWFRYRMVLRAMWKAGLIEKGVYLGALHYKEVYLRKPGVKKKINWKRGDSVNPEGV